MVKEHLSIPVIAAGGIATGRGMLAALVLGADGIQIGSRFAATEESSAHKNFKNIIIDTKDGDTHLTLKELAPVRLVKNKFYNEVQELYKKKPTKEEIQRLLGKARAKKGMFEGDLDEGELEIGQIAGLIHEIKPVKAVLDEIIEELNEVNLLVFSC
jgi:enoyl-[acyl-carrier protein] reductase II